MKQYFPLVVLVLLFGCGPKAPYHDIVTGLAVRIPFDGDVVEQVSNTSGTIHNATFVADRHAVANKAMSFVAADSATVDFGPLSGASLDSTNQFTISCWVKVSDTTSSIAVLSKRGFTGPFEYSLDSHFDHTGFTLDNWTSSGQTSIYGTDPLKAFAPIEPGQWQHLAYVADGNSLKVYINGVLQVGTDLHNTGISFTSTQAPLVIGNGGGYGRNYFFNGCIDDIYIYKRALPASTIQYLASQ